MRAALSRRATDIPIVRLVRFQAKWLSFVVISSAAIRVNVPLARGRGDEGISTTLACGTIENARSGINQLPKQTSLGFCRNPAIPAVKLVRIPRLPDCLKTPKGSLWTVAEDRSHARAEYRSRTAAPGEFITRKLIFASENLSTILLKILWKKSLFHSLTRPF